MLSRRTVLLATLAMPCAASARDAGAARESATLRAADGRAIPLSIWRASGRHHGTIAFSHGALSAPWKYPRMIDAWVAAGYDVFAPLHTDSLDHPDHRAFPGLKGWASRIADMRALSGHIGGPYIAAGHSYGALTALVLGGVKAAMPEGTGTPLRDTNARCCVAFSPPGPLPPLITRKGYAGLAVPALIETGTRDIPPNSKDDATGWRLHLTAYEQSTPSGDHYAMILDGVDHYFGGLICDPSKIGPDQSEQLAAALDQSIGFMNIYGKAGVHEPMSTRAPGLTLLHK